MCRDMLSASLSHCCWVTLCHSWRKNSSSSALFDGLWPSILLLITFQRFSMGFRSGDWAGYNRVLIWWSFIQVVLDENLLPSALTMFPNSEECFFQQDNALEVFIFLSLCSCFSVYVLMNCCTYIMNSVLCVAVLSLFINNNKNTSNLKWREC